MDDKEILKKMAEIGRQRVLVKASLAGDAVKSRLLAALEEQERALGVEQPASGKAKP